MIRHCRLCGTAGPDLPYADGAGEYCSRSCRYRFAVAPGEEIPSPGDQICPECAGWIWTGDLVHELDDRPDVYTHAHHRRHPVAVVEPEEHESWQVAA